MAREEEAEVEALISLICSSAEDEAEEVLRALPEARIWFTASRHLWKIFTTEKLFA